jgi:hypothetical protein
VIDRQIYLWYGSSINLKKDSLMRKLNLNLAIVVMVIVPLSVVWIPNVKQLQIQWGLEGGKVNITKYR